MLSLKWLPWKFVIRHIARAQGFLDPIALQARLQRFIQPSEVAEPIELLRAGAVFHARGLVDRRVIQHNLDWIWPFWVERQFDPLDPAFIPRAFSITHVNLTHRNWTAVGIPDWPDLPIVDPRGLLTPFFDGWSLDAWIVTDDGRWLLPSRTASANQKLELNVDGPAVVTRTEADDLVLRSNIVVSNEPIPVCRLQLHGKTSGPAWLVLSLRPYNPEGVSFVREIVLSESRDTWTVDGKHHIQFSEPADRHHISDYRQGDVYIHLHDLDETQRGSCDIEMATAAAMFRLIPGQYREITANIPLADSAGVPVGVRTSWSESLRGCCRLQAPDARWQKLYDDALHTLILHTPREVYAGPFTYKRFWFRDAAFIIQALVCAGLFDRAERALNYFPSRQNALGYFHSQEGEWDSNGEVLWIFDRFCQLSGRPPKPAWRNSLRRAARWIIRKRLADTTDAAHAGLLPAGFSAEHLGPSDYYYWDDFWGVAGLKAASRLLLSFDDENESRHFLQEAEEFMDAVERSLEQAATRLGYPVMPASPYRRLDAGAIGSLAVGYPLQICPPHDRKLLNTAEYLLENCFVNGGFFQDMIHSGINCYLTLHVAQVLLRAGDGRYLDLMNTVAGLASSTGQWPEAVHPRTGGGCMGDGQHAWAASEWLVMVRNCFVREENNRLILASGIPRAWLDGDAPIVFGPAPTEFGNITLTIESLQRAITVSWEASWRVTPAVIEIRLPGFSAGVVSAAQNGITFTWDEQT